MSLDITNLVHRVQSLSHSTLSFFRDHHRTTLALSSFAVTTALLYPWLNQNYHEYIALGQGGTPYNVFGWAVVTALKPFEGDTLGTEMYDNDSDKSEWLSKGDEEGQIPQRKVPRPKTGWHCIPHRQVNQFAPDDVKELLKQEFRSVAAANNHIIEVKTSAHERHGDGLFIHPSIPSPHHVAKSALREIAHIHPQKDYSMHVVLSPQDCKLVIEQGWGERHPLSGRVGLPKEYLFIYSPQIPEDVRVHGLIMRAAIKYMTGREDVH